MRILLADDSEENRFLIRGYLKDSGCIIDEVENGAQAVEQFKQRAYDVVLMDAEMPVLDGYSATREMRAFERNAAAPTPIFALTAHALRGGQRPQLRGRLHGPSYEADQEGHAARSDQQVRAPAPASDRIQVSVESWLKPVVGGYLEKRRGDVAKLRDALDRGDLCAPSARSATRWPAPAAATVSSRSPKLAARSKNPPSPVIPSGCGPSIEDLDRYLNAVQVELR